MLAPHDIESLRRSHAMAPLAPSQVVQLLETCQQMASERAEIVAVLEQLPDSFAEVRAALNQLHGILE